MEYVENFSILSPSKRGVLTDATTRAAFWFAARSTAANRVVVCFFNLVLTSISETFLVADMQPVVVFEKYVPVFPLIGGSASFF